jgi:hypothetical protein
MGAAANGFFGAVGDAQRSDFSMRKSVTGQAQDELFLNGSTARASLNGNRAWNAYVQCTAIISDAGNGTAAIGSVLVQSFELGIKRISSSTSLIDTVDTTLNKADAGMSGATFTVDADDTSTSESLRIRFTPATNAGSTTVTRCHCAVNLSEVAY